MLVISLKYMTPIENKDFTTETTFLINNNGFGVDGELLLIWKGAEDD